MATTPRPEELVDSSVLDAQGRKIGKVGTVYLSDETRNPEWVTVRTGMLGHKESFVPLQGAYMENDGIHVQVSKDQVSNAPSTDTDSDLSGEESAELYRHYDMPAPRAAMPEESTGPGEGTEGTGTAAGTAAGT
ncbi:PRC-barrel domain-containing protein, partial [Saccharomonospora halophila]|uniref:PRC-barrel domain-containing protein n=1 Tax=Saccharomonospora halophila TaxID=129922 RepID=UPI000363A536